MDRLTLYGSAPCAVNVAQRVGPSQAWNPPSGFPSIRSTLLVSPPRPTLDSMPRFYLGVGPFRVDLFHLLLLISGPRGSEDHFPDSSPEAPRGAFEASRSFGTQM
jgi:hypothetical protein